MTGKGGLDASTPILIGNLKFYGFPYSTLEEYRICIGKRQVAYAKLEAGVFAVSLAPDWHPNILQSYFADSTKGSFDSDRQRRYYLGLAADAITEKLDAR